MTTTNFGFHLATKETNSTIVFLVQALKINSPSLLRFTFLFLCLHSIFNSAIAQSDTIFKKDKKTIIGRITSINNNVIFYLDSLELGKTISIAEVNSYSRNGIMKFPEYTKGNHGKVILVDTVNISDELKFMRMCMTKFHMQYTAGLSITVLGGALLGTAYLLDGDENIKTTLGIAGAVVLLVGIVTTVDAHKWFNRAGWGVSAKGNTVEIRYRFK